MLYRYNKLMDLVPYSVKPELELEALPLGKTLVKGSFTLEAKTA